MPSKYQKKESGGQIDFGKRGKNIFITLPLTVFNFLVLWGDQMIFSCNFHFLPQNTQPIRYGPYIFFDIIPKEFFLDPFILFVPLFQSQSGGDWHCCKFCDFVESATKYFRFIKSYGMSRNTRRPE